MYGENITKTFGLSLFIICLTGDNLAFTKISVEYIYSRLSGALVKYGGKAFEA